MRAIQIVFVSSSNEPFKLGPGRSKLVAVCVNVHFWPPGDQLGSGRKEPDPKQKKMASLDASKVQSAPKGNNKTSPNAPYCSGVIHGPESLSRMQV